MLQTFMHILCDDLNLIYDHNSMCKKASTACLLKLQTVCNKTVQCKWFINYSINVIMLNTCNKFKIKARIAKK